MKGGGVAKAGQATRQDRFSFAVAENHRWSAWPHRGRTARRAKSWLFSTTGSSVSSED